MNNGVKSGNKAITLVALVITIIALLLLVGIVIASLSGENGLFSKVKETKKMQLESEMREQLTIALQELQVEKRGNATLDDVTQDWMNEVISNEYNPELQEDASYSGKLIAMSKNNIIGKFMLDANLNIAMTEYNTSGVEIEYTTISRTDNKVKINIVVTDKVNGVKQIEYPEGNPLKVVSGTKEQISIDYEVQLGREYKFVITTGDGNKTEKIIKIDDYYYNVTKNFGEGVTINNKATKTAYNKTYEATVSTEGNYAIIGLTVTMGGRTITTLGNNVVDINTGKIKIEKVTEDINIKVTTKELKIQYTAMAVSTSNSSSNTSSLEANTQEKGTTLYINIIAILEGNNCTVVSKTDNSKGVPYAITSNGKYTFIVRGTYNGKTIEEEKEVIVNQYMSLQGVVSYDAGNWTEEEIEELQSQNLYMLNKEKQGRGLYNQIYNLRDKDKGLNFTFGGFTYDGDSSNEKDIASGNIIISRNQSVAPQKNSGVPRYFGWQLLKTETKQDKNGDTIKNEDGTDRIYVIKITHAGSPENFSFYADSDYDGCAGFRAEYLLSSGKRQIKYSKLYSGDKEINPRSWQMYADQKQKDLIANTTDKYGNTIKDIHAMDYNEALAITGMEYTTTGIRNIGSRYFLANISSGGNASTLAIVNFTGGISHSDKGCYGIRPVVTMAEGVYIKSGSGTEEDPYILGKD